MHVDVEGLDAKLILSIEEKYLPNFIIYEDFNLIEDEKKQLINFLNSKGYHLNSEGGIGMAIK